MPVQKLENRAKAEAKAAKGSIATWTLQNGARVIVDKESWGLKYSAYKTFRSDESIFFRTSGSNFSWAVKKRLSTLPTVAVIHGSVTRDEQG